MQTRYETIEDVAENVETREDFVAFLHLLADNYRQQRNDWENHQLSTFLSGLDGFARDMGGYDTGMNSEHPSWKLFATMLLAARVYE